MALLQIRDDLFELGAVEPIERAVAAEDGADGAVEHGHLDLFERQIEDAQSLPDLDIGLVQLVEEARELGNLAGIVFKLFDARRNGPMRQARVAEKMAPSSPSTRRSPAD